MNYEQRKALEAYYRSDIYSYLHLCRYYEEDEELSDEYFKTYVIKRNELVELIKIFEGLDAVQAHLLANQIENICEKEDKHE